MESLTKDELLQYLDQAIALESSIYGQSQIIDEYNVAAEKCKPPAFVKEEAKLAPEPEMPDSLAAAVVGMIMGGNSDTGRANGMGQWGSCSCVCSSHIYRCITFCNRWVHL